MGGKPEATRRSTRLRRTVGRWLRFTRTFDEERVKWNPPLPKKGNAIGPNRHMLMPSKPSPISRIAATPLSKNGEGFIWIWA